MTETDRLSARIAALEARIAERELRKMAKVADRYVEAQGLDG